MVTSVDLAHEAIQASRAGKDIPTIAEELSVKEDIVESWLYAAECEIDMCSKCLYHHACRRQWNEHINGSFPCDVCAAFSEFVDAKEELMNGSPLQDPVAAGAVIDAIDKVMEAQEELEYAYNSNAVRKHGGEYINYLKGVKRALIGTVILEPDGSPCYKDGANSCSDCTSMVCPWRGY